MRMIVSGGAVIVMAIASVFSNSQSAIAIHTNHQANDQNAISQNFVSHPVNHPVNNSSIHPNSIRLPRPKGSR